MSPFLYLYHLDILILNSDRYTHTHTSSCKLELFWRYLGKLTRRLKVSLMDYYIHSLLMDILTSSVSSLGANPNKKSQNRTLNDPRLREYGVKTDNWNLQIISYFMWVIAKCVSPLSTYQSCHFLRGKKGHNNS